MKISKTKLNGVLLIEPKVWADKRGSFFESYRKDSFLDFGLSIDFIQDNHSNSLQGTLRGLHFQLPPKAQDKLVRVIYGKIFDVIVDLRKNSVTFGEWDSFILSSENKKQLFIPKGFAHGFCVMSEKVEFLYKCSDYYSPKHERGIIWNDSKLNIPWPLINPVISEKDSKYPSFADALK